MSLRSWACACACLLLAQPAFADPRYSFSLRVTAAPQTRAARPTYGRAAGEAPDAVLARIALDTLALDATRRATGALLRIVELKEDLWLQIESVSGETSIAADGQVAEIEEEVTLSTASGIALDRFREAGQSPILSDSPQSMANAFVRAAEVAARRLVNDLDASLPFARWLHDHGVVEVAPAARWPELPTFSSFLEGGVAYHSISSNDGLSFSLRSGFELPFAFVSVTAGRWSQPFTATPVFASNSPSEGSVVTNEVGFEAGPVLRLGSHVQLSVGVGAHLAWGSADFGYWTGSPSTPSPSLSFSYSQLMPALSGSLAYISSPLNSGMRFRMCLVVRHYHASAVSFAELKNSSFQPGETSVALMVGPELPLLEKGQ
jgi:hypothetical protein